MKLNYIQVYFNTCLESYMLDMDWIIECTEFYAWIAGDTNK